MIKMTRVIVMVKMLVYDWDNDGAGDGGDDV